MRSRKVIKRHIRRNKWTRLSTILEKTTVPEDRVRSMLINMVSAGTIAVEPIGVGDVRITNKCR